MPNFRLIVIGGSAGALDALKRLVPKLPADLNAAICIVLHMSPDSPGYLPGILSRFGALRATSAVDGEKLKAGAIFVAPPDRHLIISSDGALKLGSGAKENMFRPAVDPLFRSAAFGQRSIGVLLSGGLDDGVAGLAALKSAGGATIVQDPRDARVPSMPRAALRANVVDHTLSAEAIADCLANLVNTPLPETPEPVMSDPFRELETQIAAGVSARSLDITSLGKPSLFSCPHCSGVLLELDQAPLRFRCHTGHAYSAETLAALQSEFADDSVWIALRALQEQQMLLRQLTDTNADSADREKLTRAIEQTRRLAEDLRGMLNHENRSFHRTAEPVLD